MSWGVQLETEIFVKGVRKRELEGKIENNNSLIDMFERELIMLISSNPREISSEDARENGSIVEELRIKTQEIFESYKECVEQNVLLHIIFEELQKAEDC